MKCPDCGAELVQSCCAGIYHDCLDCGYSPPSQHPCNTETLKNNERDQKSAPCNNKETKDQP